MNNYRRIVFLLIMIFVVFNYTWIQKNIASADEASVVVSDSAVDVSEVTDEICPLKEICSSPGICSRYVDDDGNSECDLGENFTRAFPAEAEKIKAEKLEKENPALDDKVLSFWERQILPVLLLPNVIAMTIIMLLSVVFLCLNRWIYLRILLLLFSLIYLGFYIQGCVCPIGAFQSLPLVIMGIMENQLVYWLLIAGIPLLFILIAGRVFCGWACPMGAVQEILFRMGGILHLNRGDPGLRQAVYLKYVKYMVMSGLVVFTAILGSAVLCDYDPFYTLYSFTGGYISFTLLALVVIVSLRISRPWCRFICPYGALLGIAASAVFHVKKRMHIVMLEPEISEKSCNNCRACEKKCLTGAIKDGKIDITECIMCGTCRNICRRGAIGQSAKEIKDDEAERNNIGDDDRRDDLRFGS